MGYIIDLKCGHTNKPSDREAGMFEAHLENAGFLMKDIDNVDTPRLDIDQLDTPRPSMIGSVE